MGASTDGQICYGIVSEEGIEFPWDTEQFEGDIDEWWIRDVLGFRHSFEIYDRDGEYIGGEQPPQEKISRYHEEKRVFKENNPKLPVELVNYCSGEYPMYILAIPETCNSARRGYPTEFDPASMVVTDEQKQSLINICNAYGIEFENEPAWYLSSYWG